MRGTARLRGLEIAMEAAAAAERSERISPAAVDILHSATVLPRKLYSCAPNSREGGLTMQISNFRRTLWQNVQHRHATE